MTTYTFERFAEIIRMELQNRLSDHDITETIVVKVNDIRLHGITLRKHGSDIAPTFYLDDLYNDHTEGKSIDSIVRMLMAMVAEAEVRTTIKDTVDALDFDSIRDKLTLRLLDMERNRAYLETHPYREIGAGLVLTADVNVDDGYSIAITCDMAKDYDMDEVFNTAMDNMTTWHPARLQSMENAIFGAMSENYLEDGTKHIDGMNTLMSEDVDGFGACAIAYPSVAEKIHKLFGTDYFIIPSSLHEVLVIPDDGTFDAQGLANMVREANTTVVEPRDILSDNVFHFGADGLRRVA